MNIYLIVIYYGLGNWEYLLAKSDKTAEEVKEEYPFQHVVVTNVKDVDYNPDGTYIIASV